MGKRYRTTITHLEMRDEPRALFTPRPRGKCALLRAEKPPLHFYRYLYDTIGRNYAWVSRRKLTDEQLASIIHHDDVGIYVLYVDGAPAGFAELDFRALPEAELSFLGIVPDRLGEGLGRFLLGEALSLAWARHPNRLIVQTCTLDHPNALRLYQRAGFTPYAQSEAEFEE